MDTSIYVPNIQWIDSPLVSTPGLAVPTVAGGGVTLGPFDVSQFRSILVLVQAPTKDLTIGIIPTFPGNLNFGHYIAKQNVWSGTNGAINFPTYGSSVSIFIASLDAAAGFVDIGIYPNNLDPGFRSVDQNRELAKAQNVAIGIGATQAFVFPPYAGRAHWFFFPSSANMNFYIAQLAVDRASVNGIYTFLGGPAANTPNSGDVTLGTDLNGVLVQNNSGAATTFHLTVYGDYAQQGSF